MKDGLFKRLLAPLASIRLTVALLALSMLLIYAGTWAQIDDGIWQVQKKYFHSLFCWITFQTFFPRPADGQAGIPGGFPMLGGYTLGLLLLINLIAAHLVRFKLSWKRSGIILIHLGLILLLVGEGITSSRATEAQMSIEEGQTVPFAQDTRTAELAIIDPSSPEHDKVTVIPASMLKTGATIADPRLPVSIKIDEYFPNSQVLGPMQAAGKVRSRATTGSASSLAVVDQPQANGLEGAIDQPSAYVTLSRDGNSLGTYLVSANMLANRQPIVPAQSFEADGKSWQIALRFKRDYKPYSLSLKEFRFDRYTGTNTPKNFSSLVQLKDPESGVDREIKIWMNHPLRYRGSTFFQADWNHATERGTVLQVVSNPAWTLPYIACIVAGTGLVLHFGIALITFLRKQAKAPADRPTLDRSARRAAQKQGKSSPARIRWLSAGVLVPVIITGLCALDVLSHLRGPKQTTPYDRRTFAKLPVSHDGRVQPLDSLARNSLKALFNRESFYHDGQRTPAVQWLLDLWSGNEAANHYEIFRVDFPELLDFLELQPKKKTPFQQITGMGGATAYRFSWDELTPKFKKLQPELAKLGEKDSKHFTLFERRLSELFTKLRLYQNLSSMESMHLVPPTAAGEDWKTPAELSAGVKDLSSLQPDVRAFVQLLAHYAQKDYDAFNRSTADYTASLNGRTLLSSTMAGVRFEYFFNGFDPFTNALVLYLIGFVLLTISWLKWQVPMRRSAWCVLILAFTIHTFGLGARIYISGRPPVTNLASSALFIAWGAVLLAMAMEWIFRDGIGVLTATLIGFLSLLIGDRLAMTGDTMKVLQAVLDTNFWLATHVIVINLGYSATFLAGFVAIVYVVRGFFTRSLDKDTGKDLIRMVYGVTCFALTFSFIGTVLGGIWADQSWGRFWGWDPKENGAVLIVLANALLLHARWAGLVRERGIAALAIFGNIVTSWSWFGTNMLGVGLHSYGFMESALHWLLAFVATQIVFIAIACAPLRWWRSNPADVSFPKRMPVPAT